MPRPHPRRRPAHHRVADFDSLPALIDHAKTVDGATHLLIAGPKVTLYFPTEDGRYEAATVWQERGYWHAPAASARTILGRLPTGVEPIGSHTRRASRQVSAFGRKTQWTDWMILDAIDRGHAMPPEAERRAVKLAQLGFVDTTGTWRLTAKGRQVVDQRVPVAAEPKRGGRARGHGRPLTPESAVALAGELSGRVGGSASRAIPSAHRFGEQGAAAQFTVYSPEYQQPVVCVVGLYEDGTVALSVYSDERLSDQYENISDFTYGTGGYTSREADVGEMVETLEWVLETVDGYAASWQEAEGGEVEAKRQRRRPPPDYTSHTAHAYDIEVFYKDEFLARKHESEIGFIIGQPLVSQGPMRDGYRMEYGPIDVDDYRRLEGAIFQKVGNAANVHLVQVMYGASRGGVSEREPAFKRVGARVKYNYTDGPVPPGTLGTIVGFLPRSYQAQIRWDDESVSNHTPDEYDVVKGGGRAREPAASSGMSADDFVALLRSLAPSDRQTTARFQPSIAGLPVSRGSVYVNFVNLPPGGGHGGGGAEAENNRASFWVEGFAHDPAVPAAKVKVDQSVNTFHRAWQGAPAVPFRAKSGSPDAVARYLADYLKKIVAAVPPRFTHSGAQESKAQHMYVWQVSLQVTSPDRPNLRNERQYRVQALSGDRDGAVAKATAIAERDGLTVVGVTGTARGYRVKS